MGGQRLLINPILGEDSQLQPWQVHKEVDYVILTSARKEFMHSPTISRLNLAKTNLVAVSAAAEPLSSLMARNLAVLAPGPGGRVLLTGDKGAADIAVLAAPGVSNVLPWESPELGLIFVNLETGVAVAYEAMGLFLGANAAADREGIPEEAYQVDYLVTPDLRETAGVVKGLTGKGASLRGVVHLADPDAPKDEDYGPLLAPIIAWDRQIDAFLGGVGDTPVEFQEFLEKQGPPLSGLRLLQPVVGGAALDLE